MPWLGGPLWIPGVAGQQLIRQTDEITADVSNDFEKYWPEFPNSVLYGSDVIYPAFEMQLCLQQLV